MKYKENPVDNILVLLAFAIIPPLNLCILRLEFSEGLEEFKDYLLVYTYCATLFIEAILFCYYLSL